jgi:MFS family permease
MGIGRFAYTALLPPTQRALRMGDDVAGALASANLAGYLAGVLWARHVASRPKRSDLLRLGLAVTALATGMGTLTTAPLAWALLRAAAGVASGLVFVLASAAALEVGAPAGLLYGGVGVGMALSGGVAALAPAAAGWGAPWLTLGLAAALLAGRPGATWLPYRPRRRMRRGRSAIPRRSASASAVSPPPTSSRDSATS